jgi:hypothetical protein
MPKPAASPPARQPANPTLAHQKSNLALHPRATPAPASSPHLVPKTAGAMSNKDGATYPYCV